MPRFRIVEKIVYHKVKCYIPIEADTKEEALEKWTLYKEKGLCAWVFDEDKVDKNVLSTYVEEIDDEGIA